MDRLYIGSLELLPLPQGQAAGAAEAGGAALPEPATSDRTDDRSSPADGFMQWLAGSIANQETAVNTPLSLVHVCDDGLMLAYPGIFERYLRQEAGPEVGPVAEDRLKGLLSAVCDAGWHLRGLLNASLLQFQLDQAGDSPKFLLGMVIRSPQRFVPLLPGPNPALIRLL